MQSKFDKLVESILNEESQPYTGPDSYTQRGTASKEYSAPSPSYSRSRDRDEGSRGIKHETVFFPKGRRNDVWNAACDMGLKGKFQISDNWIAFKAGTGIAGKVVDALTKMGMEGVHKEFQ